MPSIQQQRAAFVLRQLNEMLSEDVNQKEILAYSSSFAPMVHQNGLLQAVSFYHRKGGTHKRLYDLLETWLIKERERRREQAIFTENQAGSAEEKKDLIHNLTTCSILEYRTAQAETQAMLIWLKQFAKAYCVDDAEIEDVSEIST